MRITLFSCTHFNMIGKEQSIAKSKESVHSPSITTSLTNMHQ